MGVRSELVVRPQGQSMPEIVVGRGRRGDQALVGQVVGEGLVLVLFQEMVERGFAGCQWVGTRIPRVGGSVQGVLPGRLTTSSVGDGRRGIPVIRRTIALPRSYIWSNADAESGKAEKFRENPGNSPQRLTDFPDLGQTEVRPSLTACYNVFAGLSDRRISYPTGLRPSDPSPLANLPASLVSLRFRFLPQPVFDRGGPPTLARQAESLEAASEHRTTETLGSSCPRRKSGYLRS